MNGPVGKSSGEAGASSPARDTQAADETFDPELKKSVRRKVDLHLLITLCFLFLLSFMDRINIGNVGVLGIVEDLHLVGRAFNVAVQVFFATYIPFAVPITLALKRSKPAVWICAMSCLWGIACMCQGFVRSIGGLVACRIFIGLFEAGFVPGCAYLMSMYYKPHELQMRMSLFWCAGLLAGASSGLLAYALVHMQGLSGKAGWRWVLIIEGLLSVAASPLVYRFLPNWPEQAKFLSKEEKLYLAGRTSVDVRGSSRMDELDRAARNRILLDWRIWCASLIYFGITVNGYATALFIPTIISSIGYSGIQSQIHSIPVWLTAAATTFVTSIVSDKMKRRYVFIMLGVLLASIGYIILLAQGPLATPHHAQVGLKPQVRYMAVFLVTTGCYIVQPMAVVWLANSLRGHHERAFGLPIQVAVGNIGGIIASNVFVRADAPRYFVGYGVCLAMLLLCGVMSTIFALGLRRESNKRVSGDRDGMQMTAESSQANVRDDDPEFRFII